MKKAQIKTTVEMLLTALGVKPGSFVWQPAQAELMVIVGDGFKTLKLNSGISQRALMFEMGRLAGWLEMAGASSIAAPTIEPPSKIKKNPYANTVAARANDAHPPVQAHARG